MAGKAVAILANQRTLESVNRREEVKADDTKESESIDSTTSDLALPTEASVPKDITLPDDVSISDASKLLEKPDYVVS